MADNNVDDDCREMKRQRPDDPIIGLDVCGKLYYCHQSTLTRNSQYFDSRFEGSFNADVSYQDDRRRDVYFVERSPSTFQYIFDFIIAPHDFELPSSFDENPALWRKLRCEADYFGIDGLSKLLVVSFSVKPNPGNQGLLYWLGTRRGTAKYENPHAIGAVHVEGWVDRIKTTIETETMYFNPRVAGLQYCRQRFVQHRLGLSDMSTIPDEEGNFDFHENHILACDHSGTRLAVEIDFKSIQIRPTHYSLRTTDCYGMEGNWNFDGSSDGTNWDTLHAARDDKSLNIKTRDRLFAEEINMSSQGFLQGNHSAVHKADIIMSCIEKDFRHTWKLTPEPQKFYRYFRIIGADDEGSHGGCLHGEGFELFGDLHDE